MKNGKQETVRYAIEREFLARITVDEFVNRMIQDHVKDDQYKRPEGKGS